MLSPCRTRRTAPVDTITIHVMDGSCSVQRCGQLFSTLKRGCSSNYGIDSMGNVGCYVEEEYRSWCSSNSYNDNRAITVEMANDGGATTGYHVCDTAINKLIDLLVDVCRRHNIPQLVWSDNKEDRISHKNGCNMTVHRDYAKKACPGDYLMSKMQYIADSVNAELSGKPFVYEGLDYTLVFDPKYYAAKYDDLRFAFGDNERALFNHFVTYGMEERRQAKAEFDPIKYINQNKDLQNAYDDEWSAYYKHYIMFGKDEIEKGLRMPL